MDLINHKTFREFIILSCLQHNPEGLNIHQLLSALNEFFSVDEVELFLALSKLLKENRIQGQNNAEKMQVFYILTKDGKQACQSYRLMWDGLQDKLDKLVK
ncbi:MAG: helix-turn-helix transcriptional regulator [Erysipelotrichaceae bacterium]|nr:helix-turn-helix transcriptional regulator [Erysipelotrichaceae bacterium]MDD3809179.1 helix-turn-helix transcriptional regulator [Erysipelotrichaceae bacterium]